MGWRSRRRCCTIIGSDLLISKNQAALAAKAGQVMGLMWQRGEPFSLSLWLGWYIGVSDHFGESILCQCRQQR